MNTFGNIFRFTTFGESHGPAIGGIIDGVPSGIPISTERIDKALARRAPGNSQLVTARKESDKVTFLSGIKDGLTLGTPIGFIIQNSDSHSSDYEELAHAYRPGHADFSYQAKYGIRDHRGGGRASARETACRVVAGAVAQEVLRHHSILIGAFLRQAGTVSLPLPKGDTISPREMVEYLLNRDSLPLPCPDKVTSEKMIEEIQNAKKDCDSIGGIVECAVFGVPPGLGEPVYGKLQASLASAMLSINAAKGFEYGGGFSLASLRGSECNDQWNDASSEALRLCATNYSGGIQGGISTGMPIYFRVAFKPTPTLPRQTKCLLEDGSIKSINITGRHDPCVAVRATAVVEAMAAATILDALLLRRATKPNLTQ